MLPKTLFVPLLALVLAVPGGLRAAEQLGRVQFRTSCAASQQVPFNRAVALLHDFWYPEAERQFRDILKADSHCAIAHWGVAMSLYHQIWNRPEPAELERGLGELTRARHLRARSPRERAYIDALYGFYAPAKQDYAARVGAYAAGMRALHARYPDDVDGTAFYALALLAAEPPGDTSLSAEREAEALLQPAFGTYPDHPGVVHYLIHACDTPSLAAKGLAAAQTYGRIAASGAHAAHMPGHIFARLGMWQEDIEANLTSVADSERAQQQHPMESFDEFHANQFLLYAYLQSGQDALARQMVDTNSHLVEHAESMPGMTGGSMGGMFGMYRAQFPVFYDLETRDWSAAQQLPVDAKASPWAQSITVWARALAAGHLGDAGAAHEELAHLEALMETLRKGDGEDSTRLRVVHDEVRGWVAHTDHDDTGAERYLRQAADLQDKVGQGEVDIPAREMLADLLLETGQARRALTEYQADLALSPNRFNGLYNAGRAAEGAGEPEQAGRFYAQLLRSTSNGEHSARAEFEHLKGFLAPATAQRTP